MSYMFSQINFYFKGNNVMTNYEKCLIIKQLIGKKAKYWFSTPKRLGWDVEMKKVLKEQLSHLNQTKALQVVEHSWAQNHFLRSDELDIVIESLQEPEFDVAAAVENETNEFEETNAFFEGIYINNNDCSSDASQPDFVDLRVLTYEELSNFCFKNLPQFWVDRIACIRPSQSGQLTIWFKM